MGSPDEDGDDGSEFGLGEPSTFPTIQQDDFVRRMAMRSGEAMWFLGAGASASSGVPTAGDMIWDFKQRLFVSQRHVDRSTVEDLANPFIRRQLEAHIESSTELPVSGDPEEYAVLFETVYPSEKDRRTYIQSKVSGAKPSYGYLALATLMRANALPIVWTTNFDTLTADACATVFGTTSRLTTATLDNAGIAVEALKERRWPLEVKLHGDFRSRRLKNTPDELREQDVVLRQQFAEACSVYGVVVIGYSGRDESVMSTLFEAVDQRNTFPGGLFWLLRHGEDPLPQVKELLSTAVNRGVEAAVVRIDNFDEILRSITNNQSHLDTEALDSFSREKRRWTNAPRPSGKGGWPVIRLNAIPIVAYPEVCRRVDCRIGGTAEVRKTIATADIRAIGTRTKHGVLAFGNDDDLRRAFAQYSISDFDIHSIDKRKLRRESSERGLIMEAMVRAISRHAKLNLIKGKRRVSLVPSDFRNNAWDPLREILGDVTGMLPGHADVEWSEGIQLSIEWADDGIWAVFEPRTVFNHLPEVAKAHAASFGRERTFKRYNRVLNDLIEFWAEQLSCGQQEVRSLQVDAGIDAVFQFGGVTAFSRRLWG